MKQLKVNDFKRLICGVVFPIIVTLLIFSGCTVGDPVNSSNQNTELANVTGLIHTVKDTVKDYDYESSINLSCPSGYSLKVTINDNESFMLKSKRKETQNSVSYTALATQKNLINGLNRGENRVLITVGTVTDLYAFSPKVKIFVNASDSAQTVLDFEAEEGEIGNFQFDIEL